MPRLIWTTSPLHMVSPAGLLELIILTLAPGQPSPNVAGKPTMLWEAAKTNEKLQKSWANRWPMQIWKWHTYSDASATEGQWIRPKATWKLQTCNKVKSQATTSRRGGPCASRRLCVSKACRRAFNSPSANIAGDLAQRIFRPMRMQGSFPCIIMRSKGQQVWPGPSQHSVAGPCDSPFPLVQDLLCQIKRWVWCWARASRSSQTMWYTCVYIYIYTCVYIYIFIY